MLESYHRGWKAYAGGAEVEITKNERGGMAIQLPSSDKPYDLLMEFHMPYRALTYGVMLLVALFLVVEYRRQKKNRVCNGGESM